MFHEAQAAICSVSLSTALMCCHVGVPTWLSSISVTRFSNSLGSSKVEFEAVVRKTSCDTDVGESRNVFMLNRGKVESSLSHCGLSLKAE